MGYATCEPSLLKRSTPFQQDGNTTWARMPFGQLWLKKVGLSSHSGSPWCPPLCIRIIRQRLDHLLHIRTQSNVRIVLADKVDGLVCEGLGIVCLPERAALDHLEAWRERNELLVLRAWPLEVVDLRVRRDCLESGIDWAVVVHCRTGRMSVGYASRARAGRRDSRCGCQYALLSTVTGSVVHLLSRRLSKVELELMELACNEDESAGNAYSA